MYTGTYEVRWGDLDANGHLNHSAYVNAAADLRYRYFAERGFPPDSFLALGIGAVYTSLEVRFLREVRAGEAITVTYSLSGLSPKGTRWRAHHQVLKANGKKAAVLEIEGTVLDLKTRRIVEPPPDLLAVIRQVPRAPQVEEMRDARVLG